MSAGGQATLPEPAARVRWIVAAVLVIASTAFAVARYVAFPTFSSDLDQLWHAARTLTQGGDPYAVVGPGRSFEWGFPLFYPLPAVLLAVPFSLLPLPVARIAFTALSAGALGYAIGPRWRALWPVLLSASYFLAISRNQWSPLVLAAFWLPALGFVLAAKPNIGLLAVAPQPRRVAALMLALAALVTLVSTLIRPSWIAEWIAIVRTLPNQRVAVLQPGGFVLAATLLIWRRRDARILLAAALLPQTPSVYDALPLFALCRTTRQCLVLAAATHVLQWTVIAMGPYATPSDAYLSVARLSVYLVLIPATTIALFNGRAARPDFGSPADLDTDLAGERRSRFLNYALLSAVVLSLCMELWILFHGP